MYPEGENDKAEYNCYIVFMSSINEILQEAIELPEDQRFTLVYRLLTVGEPRPSDDVMRAWDMEIRNRIQQYDRGESHSRTVSEVFKDLDDHLTT